MSKILRTALIAAALLLTPATAASAANWQYFQTDRDGYYDIAAADRNGNGTFDDVYFDQDNDGGYDTHLFNSRYGDELLETLDFDMDENDESEARLLDGDQRAGFDYVLVDRDQNGYWDNIGGYTRRIIPGSNLDYATRINRQNAGRDLIYLFRQQTGMSLLYPSFSTAY